MNRIGTPATLLLLAVTCAAQAGDPAPKRSRGGWWGDLLGERTMSLEQLLERPAPHRGQSVSVVVQLHRQGRISNPFHTKFESGRYMNFHGWADQAPLWVKKVFEAPFRHLFVKRGTELALRLEKAPEYSRWVMTGEVAEIVKGVPWIELTAAKPLPEKLDEPALVSIVKGFMLRDLKRWDASASSFHAADHDGLPRPVRSMIAREEADALHQGGKTTLALKRLEASARRIGEDPQTREALARFRKMLGITEPAPDGSAEKQTSGGNAPGARSANS